MLELSSRVQFLFKQIMKKSNFSGNLEIISVICYFTSFSFWICILILFTNFFLAYYKFTIYLLLQTCITLGTSIRCNSQNRKSPLLSKLFTQFFNCYYAVCTPPTNYWHIFTKFRLDYLLFEGFY